MASLDAPSSAGSAAPPGWDGHLDFSERLSRKVLASLRSLNESLGEVRLSVAKIDHIANQRLTLSSSGGLASTQHGPPLTVRHDDASIVSNPAAESTSAAAAAPGDYPNAHPGSHAADFVPSIPVRGGGGIEASQLLQSLLLSPSMRGVELGAALWGRLGGVLDAETLRAVKSHMSHARAEPGMHGWEDGGSTASAHAATPPRSSGGGGGGATALSGGSGRRPHTPPPREWHHKHEPGSAPRSAALAALLRSGSSPGEGGGGEMEGEEAATAGGRQAAPPGGELLRHESSQLGPAPSSASPASRVRFSEGPLTGGNEEDHAAAAAATDHPGGGDALTHGAPASASAALRTRQKAAALAEVAQLATPGRAASAARRSFERQQREHARSPAASFTFLRYEDVAPAGEGEAGEEEEEDGGVGSGIPYSEEVLSALELCELSERQQAELGAASAATPAHGRSPPSMSPLDLYTITDDDAPPTVEMGFMRGDARWPTGSDARPSLSRSSPTGSDATPPSPSAGSPPDEGGRGSSAPVAGRAPLLGRPDPRSPRYEALSLRVVYEAGRTGFEDSKDIVVPLGTLLAGRFLVRDYVGSAAFSSALACLDTATGEDVCLKMVKNNKDFMDQSLDEIKLLRYIHEAAGGDPCRYHVLRLHDFFYHREHLFLVTELLKDNLYEFQKYLADAGEEPYFTLPRIQRIARQVLEALAFLHSIGLLHSDLKPENILLKSYSKCDVKVIDFGSSCFVTDTLSTYIQSRSYRAPEVTLGAPYGPKIDVWSLGCILYELYTGQVLFANHTIQIMLARMQSLLGSFPPALQAGRDARKYLTAGGGVYARERDLHEDSVEQGDEDAGGGRSRDPGWPEPTDPATFLLLHPHRVGLRARLRAAEATSAAGGAAADGAGNAPPDPLSAEGGFLDFLVALLTLDPGRRPTAAQALRHPWLTSSVLEVPAYLLPNAE